MSWPKNRHQLENCCHSVYFQSKPELFTTKVTLGGVMKGCHISAQPFSEKEKKLLPTSFFCLPL